MTPREIAAFNAGVETLARFAAECAEAMRAKEVAKPTRYPYATDAFQAIADSATTFMLPMQGHNGPK